MAVALGRLTCRPALQVVDEIGYLPITSVAAICSSSSSTGYENEKGLTSNRGFAEQREIFGDPVVATVLLDRRLHHADRRIKLSVASHADLVPEHLRAKDLATPPPAPPAAECQKRSPKIAKKAHHRPNPTRPLPPSCVRGMSRARVCRNFAPLGACNSL